MRANILPKIENKECIYMYKCTYTHILQGILSSFNTLDTATIFPHYRLLRGT